MDGAGRTDKGVSACGQVVSFHSWQDIPCKAIARCLAAAHPGALRAIYVQRMPRSFHAMFSVSPDWSARMLLREQICHRLCTCSSMYLHSGAIKGIPACASSRFEPVLQAVWRRYIYLLPLHCGAGDPCAATVNR